MKTKLSVLAVGLMIFSVILPNCVSVSIYKDFDQFMRNAPISGDLRIIDSSLERKIFIDNIDIRKFNNSYSVRMRIGNKTNNSIDFEYKVEIFSEGIRKDNTNRNWLPEKIGEKDFVTVKFGIPENYRGRFEILLKKGGNNE